MSDAGFHENFMLEMLHFSNLCATFWMDDMKQIFAVETMKRKISFTNKRAELK